MLWSTVSFLDVACNAIKAADQRIQGYIAGNPVYHEPRAGILRKRFRDERYFQRIIAESLMGWPLYMTLDSDPGKFDMVFFTDRTKSDCVAVVEMKLKNSNSNDGPRISRDIAKLRKCEFKPRQRIMIVFAEHPIANTNSVIQHLSNDLESELGYRLILEENFYYRSFKTFSAYQKHPDVAGKEMEFMVAAIEVIH